MVWAFYSRNIIASSCVLSPSFPFSFLLSLSLSFSLGHKNTNVRVPLILKVLDITFLWGNAFLRVFLGGLDLFNPKIALHHAKCPIICFARKKKNNQPDFQNQRCINSYNSLHFYWVLPLAVLRCPLCSLRFIFLSL